MPIVTHLGQNLNWTAYKNGHNNFTITITQNGSAFNISTYTFVVNITKVGGTTNLLQLTEASGITNGGAAGTLAIALTQAQASTTLPGSDYWYEIAYTKDSKVYAFLQGSLTLSDKKNPESTTTSVSVSVSLAGSAVSAAVTLAGGSGGGSWGEIEGTLSDQADLNTALGLKAPLASPTFTGTPAAPTAAAGTDTTQIATTAYVRANAMVKGDSDFYPGQQTFQVQPVQVLGNGCGPFEIVNTGNSGSTETRNLVPVAVYRHGGNAIIARNIEWDVAGQQWLTPYQEADAYGTSLLECGGEAVILHATPPGVDFSDVPHEILLASANGTDGPNAESVSTGYFVQIKAPLFARFDSAAYNPLSTGNTWNDTTGTHPLVWLSTGENKVGTDNELLRLEGNNAVPGGYFKRSNGTLASRTIASASASGGKLCWAYYDGSDFETTSQIDSVTNSSVSANNMGSKIRFLTSPTTTANLAVRMEIQSDGKIVINGLPTSSAGLATGTLWNDGGTVKVA